MMQEPTTSTLVVPTRIRLFHQVLPQLGQLQGLYPPTIGKILMTELPESLRKSADIAAAGFPLSGVSPG